MMKLVYLFAAFAVCLCLHANAQGKFNAHQLLTDIKTLSSDAYQGRLTGSAGSKKAQEYITQRFLEFKLMPFNGYYEQNFSFEQKAMFGAKPAAGGAKLNGTNLIGYIEGKTNKNLYTVVTAHYDHLGIRNNEIYNGADDNASGLAAMFAIADHFSRVKPEHSIIFVAIDAEEFGLKGAYHFVDNLPIKKEQIALNINVDMISRNDQNELYACGTYHYPFLKPYLEKHAANYSIKLRYGHDMPENISAGVQDWTFASDHGAFHKVGIPFIYFGVEDHPDYHKPTDRFETINQVFFIKATDMVLDYLIVFDQNLSVINTEKNKPSNTKR